MSDPIGSLFAQSMGLNPNFLGDIPRATYSEQGGTINPTDRFSLVNSATAIFLTLPSGTRDGQPLIIKNLGAGALTLSASIDGNAVPPGIASLEALRLIWSAASSTWISV